MIDDRKQIIEAFRKGGFADKEAEQIYGQFARTVDEKFLEAIVSRLTMTETTELKQKLGGVSDVIAKRGLIRRACLESVSKVDFDLTSREVSASVWADVFSGLDQVKAQRFEKILDVLLGAI